MTRLAGLMAHLAQGGPPSDYRWFCASSASHPDVALHGRTAASPAAGPEPRGAVLQARRRLDSRAARRVLGLIVAALCAVALLVAPGAARADPGTCAVRSWGPTPVDTYLLYTIRNRCTSQGIHVRVVFPSYGRSTGCAYVGPTGYQTFDSIYYDPNWVIRSC